MRCAPAAPSSPRPPNSKSRQQPCTPRRPSAGSSSGTSPSAPTRSGPGPLPEHQRRRRDCGAPAARSPRAVRVNGLRSGNRGSRRPPRVSRSYGSIAPEAGWWRCGCQGGVRGGTRFPPRLIGVPRFELGTSPTRTERATRLRHTPRVRRLAQATSRRCTTAVQASSTYSSPPSVAIRRDSGDTRSSCSHSAPAPASTASRACPGQASRLRKTSTRSIGSSMSASVATHGIPQHVVAVERPHRDHAVAGGSR